MPRRRHRHKRDRKYLINEALGMSFEDLGNLIAKAMTKTQVEEILINREVERLTADIEVPPFPHDYYDSVIRGGYGLALDNSR